jgi:hypothetical protein
VTVLDLHGLRLELCADDPLVRNAVLDRVRRLPAAVGDGADLRFRYVNEVARPEGAGRPVYDPARGEVVHFDGRDCLFIDLGDSMRALCEPARGAVRVSAGRGDRWLLSRPLFTLPLLELAKRRGLYAVHAGALARDGNGLLLAGTSGAGKSTLTIALLRAGFDFLGDDLLFLARGDGELRGLALPEDIDVTAQTVSFWPELEAHLRPAGDGAPKARFAPEECFGSRCVPECVPRALVFPRIAGRPESRLREIGAAEALLELVPNVLLTEPASSQAHLDALGALVAQCACYRLETGQDWDALPELLGGLL